MTIYMVIDIAIDCSHSCSYNMIHTDVLAYGPPAFLRFLRCDMLRGGGAGVGGITFLVFVFFDLRWARLLYFGGHTSSYVGQVFCISVDALHLTLDTSSARKLAWRENGTVAKRMPIHKK